MKTINEQIVEIDNTIKEIENLIEGLTTESGITGSSGASLGISTLCFLDVTLKTDYDFMPSVMNTKYEFRAAQNIALPIVQKELSKLKKERERLTGNWFTRTFRGSNY